MNRKAFELSINFIVMLILAITVFGFGLYFVQKLFVEAKDIRAQLDRDTESSILALLDRGDKVSIPITSKDIKQDGLAMFGLGIINVKDNPARFIITVECSVAVNSGGGNIEHGCDGKWTLDSFASFTLQKNEKKVIPIPIQPPKGRSVASGTYGFTVTVKAAEPITANPTDYSAPKQIYVNID